MKSGLEGRNNPITAAVLRIAANVSMKSGLEGRNNLPWKHFVACRSPVVSMKSGLEGRNNAVARDVEKGFIVGSQ